MSEGHHYFVPLPSRWPAICSAALFLVVGGFIFIFNGLSGGTAMFVVGFVVLLYVMVGWWGDVARESEGGRYKDWEDMSFRWGMGWFIVSEVMFFGAFFGVLFYARNISVPDLGAAHSKILWPEYNAIWPTAGPYFSDKFGTIPTFACRPLIP